jgi:hypothetical protein
MGQRRQVPAASDFPWPWGLRRHSQSPIPSDGSCSVPLPGYQVDQWRRRRRPPSTTRPRLAADRRPCTAAVWFWFVSLPYTPFFINGPGPPFNLTASSPMLPTPQRFRIESGSIDGQLARSASAPWRRQRWSRVSAPPRLLHSPQIHGCDLLTCAIVILLLYPLVAKLAG